MSQDKIILEFPVLWLGWECDSKGWVKTVEGKNVLIMTTHGSPYRAKPGELLERIKEYKRVIALSQEALALLDDDWCTCKGDFECEGHRA